MSEYKQKSIFFQSLISYLLILILPLLIVGIVVYSYFENLLQEQAMSNHRNMIEQVKIIMDDKLLEMTDIALKTSSNTELLPNALKNFYDVYRSKNSLAFQEGNLFIDDYMLYIRDGNYIYTSKSTYTLSIFFRIYNFYDKDSLLEKIQHIKEPTILYPEEHNSYGSNSEKLITFMKPIPLNSNNPYGTAMFIVKEESIRTLYREIIKYRDSNVFIIDENGHIISSMNAEPVFHIDLLSYITSLDSEGSTEIVINDNIYLVSYVQSEMSEWTYITMISKNEL